MKAGICFGVAAISFSSILACGGGGGGTPTPECDKAANVARRAELVASQPALGARTKSVISVETTFPSVADDPSVDCPVTLQFKDLNDSGSLDGYEDWRKTADERAADLLGRMTPDQKMALMAHATTTDAPTFADASVSASLAASVAAGIRFGRTSANASQLTPRATWANNVQELCEASSLGIPFVLSTEPAHASGAGRTKARGFSQWPLEPGLGAASFNPDGTLRPAAVQGFAQVVNQEYRALGIRMALSPSADLATDPRWFGTQFTFGEDPARVAPLVEAYVRGVQGEQLGPASVACVVSHFPGAGPAKGGWDARLAKGKYVTYPGNAIDSHLAPFESAIQAGVAGVMPGYGIPEEGTWTGLGGLLDGTSIEQVGAAFHAKLLGDVLRGHYGFAGLVLAPWGILEEPGVSPLGAPWGMEASTRAERVAKAVNAGVDQFGGLGDIAPVAAARTAGAITDARIDAAATRALTLIFTLGLFEDPYVDPLQAPALCNTDPSRRSGLDAMNRGLVLLVNADKPTGWLNGELCPSQGGPPCDGTQVGDPGNAGNGTLKVLPAPPGQPYIAAGCDYFVAGDFNLDYVRSVSTGYGLLTNDALEVKGVPVSTAAERMALSDYVFVRIAAPFSADPDAGALGLPLSSLEWATNDNAAALQAVADARAAVDAWAGPPASQAQIIVAVDSGRPSVVDEVLALGVSGLYVGWTGTEADLYGAPDKVLLDVAFGIFDGRGKLPVGLPASDVAAAAQLEDLPGDGQHATYVDGYGISTDMF